MAYNIAIGHEQGNDSNESIDKYTFMSINHKLIWNCGFGMLETAG
jgi:hypothetical protein